MQVPVPEIPVERRLILSYAPDAGREGLGALMALDDALAVLLRTTREPALGQLRLAWWRESLEKLDRAAAPAEPTLQWLERSVVGRGVSGESLVPVVHGWEVLVEEEQLDQAAMERFGAGRARLFLAAGAVMGAAKDDPLLEAGQGWALADLSAHLTEPQAVETAREMARPFLAQALARKWSSNGRALGAMTHLAQMRLEDKFGPVQRVSRLLWHRLSGR
ncbi:hypothetical protein [Sphingomonas sp. S2-65]|uniref:hypothetical protein n=1 Tax=Sphingomonas sp. S2-65 TaxID=2903960 RepID=UPI001F24B144|nr:hypothetical protein [Sphingomonas sp. S2-65]UYY58925.1 hypothetical protein LZ586_02115 [Sphingomonas sp. S2-65]